MLSSGGNITALTIDRDLAALVVAESRGGRWHRTGGFEVAGGIDPKDLAALKGAVGKAMDGAGLGKKAQGAATDLAVSISDHFAFTGIFSFNEFPESGDDAEAIVRLRARKEFALTSEVRVDYQILDAGVPTRVLVVAIAEGLAAAIEGVLEERGAVVGRIGLTSFHLANLVIEEKAPPSGNFSVAVVIGTTLTLMIFAGGKLDFYRTKTFKGGAVGLARDLRMSYVSYGGDNRGAEKLLLLTDEFTAAGAVEVEGVDVVLINSEVFLEQAGGASPEKSSNILRLAAIGACL